MTPRERDDLALELFRPISTLDAVWSRLARHGMAAALPAAAGLAFYAAYAIAGLYAPRDAAGALHLRAISAPVEIVRDARDVPHVRAATLHDLYVAQGFVEGSDRLFEMELARRYAYGTLAEMLGPKALPIDRERRYDDVRDAAASELARAPRDELAALQAFSDGVNDAIRVQPLPVEFRLLLFRPQPWTPRDSIAVSLAVSGALADSWRDVLARDEVWRRVGSRAFDAYFPLSDPRYDVTLAGAFVPSGHRLPRVAWTPRHPMRLGPRLGSNAWAAGARRAIDGRALIANDPHLDLTIPGLWYVVDLQAPGMHVAGAAIPGVPGVVLGHNERVAWAATNGDAAAASLFELPHPDAKGWVRERFAVRFGVDAMRSYYRTPSGFGVPGTEATNALVLVRDAPRTGDRSGIATFLRLDRARNDRDALRALSGYDGAAENFVVADRGGEVAYHLAGSVVDDPAWGRYVHPARDASRRYPALAFERLPATRPQLGATIVTANNKMYGPGYPYRLAAAFDPPYRAYRIAQLLDARSRYDAAYFASMQLDTFSPADAELAHEVARSFRTEDDPAAAEAVRALARWDGRFDPNSRAATLAYRLRTALESDAPSLPALLDALRRGDASENVTAEIDGTLYDAVRTAPWRSAGAVPIDHPLAPLRFAFLNGKTLPGAGDDYTVRLQEPGFAQSFRAVWEVGAWNAGGIAIPSGESGNPGSAHYTDLTRAWIAGTLSPLPFGRRAVDRAAVERLTLLPQRR
ncbi:MAG TPA: penicillin acylase family protein [Candidatus Acidoferrales bacterium]|nr:penicillin acylase family protein [Candidatus Acidoferrales bacterium]